MWYLRVCFGAAGRRGDILNRLSEWSWWMGLVWWTGLVWWMVLEWWRDLVGGVSQCVLGERVRGSMEDEESVWAVLVIPLLLKDSVVSLCCRWLQCWPSSRAESFAIDTHYWHHWIERNLCLRSRATVTPFPSLCRPFTLQTWRRSEQCYQRSQWDVSKPLSFCCCCSYSQLFVRCSCHCCSCCCNLW